MKYFWIVLVSLIFIGLLGILCSYFIVRQVRSFSSEKIKNSIGEIPDEEPPPVVIVYGAAVLKNGKLSSVLYDRVYVAAELYKAKKVKKLLMSGDNSRKEYDEPTAMKNAAIELGVPEADIVTDFAGRRTYDTCYRAKEIFEIKKAIHVTQKFHLPRAIYLCEKIGIESIGLKADRQRYRDEDAWNIREFLAVVSAWFEINFVPFEPIGGRKEPIDQ
ncbi:MAG: ElyC/SanA/YdcF family protein [Pyrinomonadaceae bacterium]